VSDDLNDFLTEIIGRVPREDVVDYLQKQAKAELIKRGEQGEGELLSMYLELERRFEYRSPGTIVEIPPDSRTRTLSNILALEAAGIEDVIRFRNQHLKGKLLEPAQVAQWVKAKARKDKTTRTSTAKGPRGSGRSGHTRPRSGFNSMTRPMKEQHLLKFNPIVFWKI
jgi:hypothetical protein